MKTRLFFFFNIIFILSLTAQTGVEATYRVVYKYPGNPLKNVFKLKANAKQSRYSLITGKDTVFIKKSKRGHTYTRSSRMSPKRLDYYLNFSNGHIAQVYSLKGRTIEKNDTTAHLQWHIQTAHKLIGQYQAIKATTAFRGRNYVAWFTPQIPIKAGPWKFHGLPGLILEAYDVDDYIYHWTLQSVHYPVSLPPNLFKIDPRHIDKIETLREAFEKRQKKRRQTAKIRASRIRQKGIKKVDSHRSGRRFWLEKKYEWEK